MSKGKKIFDYFWNRCSARDRCGRNRRQTIYGSVQFHPKTYESVERKNQEEGKKRETPVNLDEKDSFSVLLLGIDTGDLGRTDQDVQMRSWWQQLIQQMDRQRSLVCHEIRM